MHFEITSLSLCGGTTGRRSPLSDLRGAACPPPPWILKTNSKEAGKDTERGKKFQSYLKEKGRKIFHFLCPKSLTLDFKKLYQY